VLRFTAIGAAILLAGCATAPLQPDPAVELTGRWTIVAVDGERTGGGRRFNLEINPAFGSAQFGCNTGSGEYQVRSGWFFPADPWIITAADCPHLQGWRHFERKGFQILTNAPLAIHRSRSGVSLRNAIGSIDLVPAPPVTAAEIVGTWNVYAINDVATPGGSMFRAVFNEREIDGYFGCNRYSGPYSIENGRLRALARRTEKGCELLNPDTQQPPVPVSLMKFEEWAFAILDSHPDVVLRGGFRGGNRMSLVSPAGRIELSRAN
jgi:heat shock protein HslJ